MASIFKIKYLFELYPDTDFEEELTLCHDVTEVPNTSDVQVTEDNFGDVRSVIKRKRKIQSIIYRDYEVKIVLARNIGFPVLDYAEYTELTTQDDDIFLIYDVNISYTKVPQSLNYVVEIKFRREEENIANHLSSDNVLTYKTDESETVNEIQFDVTKPSYAFRVDIVKVGSYYQFSVDSTDELSQISALDYYYGHVQDSSFDNQTYYELYVTTIIAGVITFRFNSATAPSNFGEANIVINQERNELPTSSNVESNPVTNSYVIYTFLEPIFSHDTDIVAGFEAPDGIEENQKTIEKDVCEFKVWLKKDELYLAENLNYALASDIVISLKNYDDIYPSQTKEIITPNANKNLIDLYEFDIKVLYNNKVVNINR